jgi:DNA-binding XRE family transcriptional regulator
VTIAPQYVGDDLQTADVRVYRLRAVSDAPDLLVRQRAAFGRRLRELRTSAGLTQETVAFAAGTDRSYLVEIEGGQHSPGLELVLRLALALRVAPRDLFDVAELSTPP